MRTPSWESKWNPNTLISVAGFTLLAVGGFMAWGYAVAEFKGGLAIHSVDIERLDKRLQVVETDTRRLDNHELRLSNMEKQATDGVTAMRALESTLNGVTGDIKVVREILQRIEAAQQGDGTTRP